MYEDQVREYNPWTDNNIWIWFANFAVSYALW